MPPFFFLARDQPCRRWLSQLALGVLLSVLMGTGALQAQPTQLDAATGLAVGQVVPDLVLPSLDGTPLSLHEFRGKKLILHVFASW